jgi:hypothetical protein
MEDLSPEVPRVNLPTVFYANSLMQDPTHLTHPYARYAPYAP